MVSVTIEEISENLSAYLQRVAAGESFVVLVEGKAIAEIKPTTQPSLANALVQLRQICQREDYSLEIPPRSDRANPLVILRRMR